VPPPLAPRAETAFAIVAFHLGVNPRTNLDPTTQRVDDSFRSARELAALVAPLVARLPPSA
jgi:hypothetical protein